MNLISYKGLGREVDQEAADEYVRQGYLLAPKTVFKGRAKCVSQVFVPANINLEHISAHLEKVLEDSMKGSAGQRRAVMFSGGFDSMLVALLARKAGAKVTAVTIGFEDFNPLTVEGAAQSCRQLGLTHEVIYVKTTEFVTAFGTLSGLTDEPVLDLDLAIVYAALKKYNPDATGNVFFSGMGSDQWFGHMSLEPWPGGLDGRLNKAMVNVDSHNKVAEVFGCRMVFPFLSLPSLGLSRVIPARLKKNKQALRSLPIANQVPHRGVRSEMQVPDVMRRVLIRKYGDRAWPHPISDVNNLKVGSEHALRQIALGLWLEAFQRKLPSHV